MLNLKFRQKPTAGQNPMILRKQKQSACKAFYEDCEEVDKPGVEVGASAFAQTNEMDSSLIAKLIAVCVLSGFLGWVSASYTCRIEKNQQDHYATLPTDV